MSDFTEPHFGVTVVQGPGISICGMGLDEAYVAVMAAVDEGCPAYLIYAGMRIAFFRPVDGKPIADYPSTFVRCHRQLACQN